MKKLSVKTKSKTYEVVVGINILNQKFLEEFSEREAFLVIDSNVPGHIKKEVQVCLESISSKFATTEIQPNEGNKSYTTLSFIHDKLVEQNFSRNCVLFALGGGITCDITGFAAATYQRGVDFVLLPSTLLSQVDASVGGKTAINHPKGKNMIGAFHQPVKVLSDTKLLSSLSKRQINEGLAEIIKHALLTQEGFFEWLNKNIDNLLEKKEIELMEAVYESIKIKASIVEQDEKENGMRKFLNLGHTFGHAIELYGSYEEFSHGEAVALGILMALNLSIEKLDFELEKADEVRKLIKKLLSKEKIQKEFDSKKLFNLMASDKKRIGNSLNFILLEKIGKPKIVSDVEDLVVMNSMKIS